MEKKKKNYNSVLRERYRITQHKNRYHLNAIDDIIGELNDNLPKNAATSSPVKITKKQNSIHGALNKVTTKVNKEIPSIDYSHYYSHRQYSCNISEIDWEKYFDRIYLIHLNEENDEYSCEMERYGIISSCITTVIDYKHTKEWEKLKFFKKEAILRAVKDAYTRKYKRILIITDDVKFLGKDLLYDILEDLPSSNIILANPGDIGEDCYILNKAAIGYIAQLPVDYRDINWVETIKNAIKNSKLTYKALKTPIFIHKIDFVIPYVDNNDPNWAEIHNTYLPQREINESNTENRYRDWGNFMYVFRGLDKYMPFINHVYLIVMSGSQVPFWINKNKVRIVYHKDIIPEELLPTFNSCTIESYIGNIPNLSEYFIYSNDDLYVLNKINARDLYGADGYPIVKIDLFKYNPPCNSVFTCQSYNSFEMVEREFGRKARTLYPRPGHMMCPLRKSACAHLYYFHSEELEERGTKFRDYSNVNQYIYTNYLWLERGEELERYENFKYCSMGREKFKIIHFIESQKINMICINDSRTEEVDAIKLNTEINHTLQQRLPDKSKYEN